MEELFLKRRPKGGAYRTSDKNNDLWRCNNPISLTCTYHGDEIAVPCGRWRTCGGCARRLQFRLRTRFLAGIATPCSPFDAMFATLTFPQAEAPSEADAHGALRSLIRRLRWRDQLGWYGWVLQRTRAGTLHYHGIFCMRWQTDDLAEWRRLIQASGFGLQNRLVVARPEHAGYCTRYISQRLADLAPLRRAYSFSRDFPLSDFEQKRRERDRLLEQLGAESECAWELSGAVAKLLR